MTDSAAVVRKPSHRVEDHLRQIVKLLEKHRLIEIMVDRDRLSPRHDLIESLVHRQHLVELQLKLRSLDVCYPSQYHTTTTTTTSNITTTTTTTILDSL